ncbi:MAG: hypothetical protein G01um10142_478 [Parcubacteria group bacterium Gr01-1014_2]|nr:MAG: hypothetical protein G01um10142_478 [Parcubacteria group bacterium Gr01-1014_2]
MGTVRDFKDLLLKESRVSFGGQFTQRSEAHRAFWKKLNDLGARNMKSQPPESVPDIDATVHLTDQEWTQLEAEFRQLR